MVITVFGSGRCTKDSQEYELARSLGRELAGAGFTVCNGGYGGVMEAAARGAKDAGGKTIGITVESFGPPNRWIDREIPTKTLMERLVKLIETGNGYVVLRGGTGTLLELSAVWELFNKGMMVRKPVIVFSPFWSPLVSMMRKELSSEGKEEAANLPIEVSTVGDCVRQLTRLLG